MADLGLPGKTTIIPVVTGLICSRHLLFVSSNCDVKWSTRSSL